MKIQPIVEGHGDVHAFPVLMRRLRDEARAYAVNVAKPIRQKRGRLLKKEHLERAVLLAKGQSGCGAILIAFDADEDCPMDVKDSLEAFAGKVSAPIPCRVVIPKREYEAWFLASAESLRGKRGILSDATSPSEPEAIRDAKGALEARMASGWSYMETVDQAALSALFDMRQAFVRCRSFRRMVTAFGDLLHAVGVPPRDWPPRSWLEACK